MDGQALLLFNTLFSHVNTVGAFPPTQYSCLFPHLLEVTLGAVRRLMPVSTVLYPLIQLRVFRTGVLSWGTVPCIVPGRGQDVQGLPEHHPTHFSPWEQGHEAAALEHAQDSNRQVYLRSSRACLRFPMAAAGACPPSQAPSP